MFYFKFNNPFENKDIITEVRVLADDAILEAFTTRHLNEKQSFSAIPYYKTLLIVSPTKMNIKNIFVNGMVSTLDEADSNYIIENLELKSAYKIDIEFNGLW